MFLIKIIGQTWEVLVEFVCVILYMKEDIFSSLDTFLSEIYKILQKQQKDVYYLQRCYCRIKLNKINIYLNIYYIT